MWSNRPHVACKLNDGLKSSWSQEPKTKTDELIWIWTQEQIEARSPAAMWWKSVKHWDDLPGNAPSKQWLWPFQQQHVCKLCIWILFTCYLQYFDIFCKLSNTADKTQWWIDVDRNFTSACWQGSVFDRPRLCHRGTWALQEKLQTFNVKT